MSDRGHVLHVEFAPALSAAWAEASAAFERYRVALALLDDRTLLGSLAGDGYLAVAAAGDLLAALDRLERVTRSTCCPAGWHPEVVHGAAAPRPS